MGNEDKWKKGRESAERESAGSINRVKFPAPAPGQTSTTILVLLEDDFETCYSVFVDDTQGGKRRINISAEDWKNVNQDHPLIGLYKKTNDDNLRASRKYFLNCAQGVIKRFQKRDANKKIIMDGDKPKVFRKVELDPITKLLEVGPKIFQQIASYREDEDYPAIDACILKIERQGSGKNDTSYVVKATAKNVPSTEGLEGLNLVELSEPTSYAEVRKILGMAPVEGDETPEPEAEKQLPEGAQQHQKEEAAGAEEEVAIEDEVAGAAPAEGEGSVDEDLEALEEI